MFLIQTRDHNSPARLSRTFREARIKISNDGKEVRDNLFIERLWRTVKYESVSKGISEWERCPNRNQ